MQIVTNNQIMHAYCQHTTEACQCTNTLIKHDQHTTFCHIIKYKITAGFYKLCDLYDFTILIIAETISTSRPLH